MKTINFSFIPAVGYSGHYTAVAYGTVNPSIPLGQTILTGPYGSTVTGTIASLPDDTQYKVNFFTDACTDPVGTHTYNV